MIVKRLIVFLLVLFSIIAITAFASAETYTVSTEIDVLNVRSQIDSDIILGGIRAGKKVEIDYHDKYWGYFYYDGQPAKVYFDYLVPAAGSPEPQEPTSSGTSKKTQKKEAEPKFVSDDEAKLVYRVSPKVNYHIKVRAKKSDSAKVIGRLEPGEEVHVVAIGKTWTRIVYDNQYGFVYSKNLVDTGDNLPEGGELYRVKVKGNTTLNVREEDTRKSKIIIRLRNGALVKVFEKQEKWSFVYFNKTDFGYVMNKFIVKVDE